MRLRPSPGLKRISGVFRAQRTCLVAAKFNVVFALWDANNAHLMAEVWMFVRRQLKLTELLYFHFIDAYSFVSRMYHV